MTDEQRMRRGRRALAEFEELGGVFERLERAVFAELQQTPIGADAKVVRLHMTLHNLAGLQAALREMIDDGRVAEQALALAGLNRG
jgi:hypothetical protein